MLNLNDYERDPVRGLQINYYLGADYRSPVPVYNSGFGGVNESTTRNDTVDLLETIRPCPRGSLL